MDLNRPDVKRELDRELAGLRFGNLSKTCSKERIRNRCPDG